VVKLEAQFEDPGKEDRRFLSENELEEDFKVFEGNSEGEVEEEVFDQADALEESVAKFEGIAILNCQNPYLKPKQPHFYLYFRA